MRAIIMCAGQGTRWEGDPPKHLVEIDGEPILHRTVRQLLERGIDDVWVTSDDPRYEIPGAKRYGTPGNEWEIDKFYAARRLWQDAHDFRHFYGDVYYTDEAMDLIVGAPPEPFRFYGRKHGSRITGTRHGEMFALAFTDHELVAESCRRIRVTRIANMLIRGGSWELYQVLQGLPPRPYSPQHFDERFTEIDDRTEDFDTREEYDTWIRYRLEAEA